MEINIIGSLTCESKTECFNSEAFLWLSHGPFQRLQLYMLKPFGHHSTSTACAASWELASIVMFRVFGAYVFVCCLAAGLYKYKLLKSCNLDHLPSSHAVMKLASGRSWPDRMTVDGLPWFIWRQGTPTCKGWWSMFHQFPYSSKQWGMGYNAVNHGMLAMVKLKCFFYPLQVGHDLSLRTRLPRIDAEQL